MDYEKVDLKDKTKEQLKEERRFLALNSIRAGVSEKIDTSRDYSDEDILLIIDAEINSFGRKSYLSVSDKLYVRKRIFK
jgi:hypothetical protein